MKMEIRQVLKQASDLLYYGQRWQVAPHLREELRALAVRSGRDVEEVRRAARSIAKEDQLDPFITISIKENL